MGGVLAGTIKYKDPQSDTSNPDRAKILMGDRPKRFP